MIRCYTLHRPKRSIQTNRTTQNHQYNENQNHALYCAFRTRRRQPQQCGLQDYLRRQCRQDSPDVADRPERPACLAHAPDNHPGPRAGSGLPQKAPRGRDHHLHPATPQPDPGRKGVNPNPRRWAHHQAPGYHEGPGEGLRPRQMCWQNLHVQCQSGGVRQRWHLLGRCPPGHQPSKR